MHKCEERRLQNRLDCTILGLQKTSKDFKDQIFALSPTFWPLCQSKGSVSVLFLAYQNKAGKLKITFGQFVNFVPQLQVLKAKV